MPRNPSRIAWYAALLALGAGALYWALVLRPGRVQRPPLAKGGATSTAQREADVRGQQPAEWRATPGSPRLRAAVPNSDEDPESIEVRKAALGALFAEPNLPKKLSTVLAAVEADSTPPERDPLWPVLVSSLSQVWRGEALTRGLNLMLAESRPRARRALVSSFAFLATSGRAKELTAAQSQTLTNDFIDIYKQLPRTQQPEVLAALREVAGPDVADVLVGRSSELERKYARALEETQAAAGPARAPAAPAQ